MALFLSGAVFFCIWCIWELDFSLLENRSQVVYDAQGEILGFTLSRDNDSYRFLVTPEEVSPLYLKMLIASEDRRFYQHFGVDFLALPRALFNNISSGERTSGGSTLAMQVAKRLTGHERTYFNKLKEIVQASYLTLRYGRNQVLSWYLTLSPFGSNIEGIKAASLRWFGHLPNVLTPSEAALLTALPRAPEHIRPDRNPQAARYYKNQVLRLSYEQGVINRDLWEASLEDRFPDKLQPIVQKDRSFATYLAQRDHRREIHTTVNKTVQTVLAEEASNFRQLHQDGAVLSVVVLDVKNHTMAGILGTSDEEKTQLCLPFALRSPGSALKPFAYGLAFQYGKIFPDTLLHDESRLFGSWQPENFSRTFSGKVPASLALATSLNLPALEVLNMVGTEQFAVWINQGNNRLITKNSIFDPSIILGSGSITLYDLAELYAMIHEDGMAYDFGMYEPFVTGNNAEAAVNIREDDQNEHNRDVKDLGEGRRMLSPDSARAVFEILKMTARPSSALTMKDVSYKTGTSSRFTDALAVGSMGRYTVAVAIRFPDNRTGYYRYTGYVDAAPVLFSIFQRLQTRDFPKPELKSPLLDGSRPQALLEAGNKESVLGRDELKIDFPGNGDTVLPDHAGRIFVNYRGGKGKIYLTVGDQQTEEQFFIPDHEGTYILSISDEYGHSDTTVFQVVLP